MSKGCRWFLTKLFWQPIKCWDSKDGCPVIVVFWFLLGHFRTIHKGYAELLCGCALRQQLCHDHQPLIAAVSLVILPAAGGEGQNSIFLGEGHAIKVKPVFPRNRLKEAGQIIQKGELLGQLKSMDGTPLASYYAEAKSVILYYTVSLGVQAGDPLIAYGSLESGLM